MRGIGTYLRGLLSGFKSAGVADELGLLLEGKPAGPGDAAPAGFRTHPYRLRTLNRHARPLLDPLQVSLALRKLPPSLYHAIEYAQPIVSRVPVVVTIHDLIPFVLPHQYPWMRRERTLAMRQLRHADAVIAVSASTSADAQRIAGVDPRRITVIPEGVRAAAPLTETQLADLRRALRLPDRFVLAVGTFDPRKRVDTLADVVRILRTEHDTGLVIAGFQGNFAQTVKAAVTKSGIGAATRVLGHVSKSELAALYQMTECLLFTSAYEGFGLPPLEAMAAGAPVAVFDNSSLPEVVGDAGLVIPDGDGAAMARAVSGLLGDPRELQRRAALGRTRSARFTWEGAARATLAVYQAALDGG